MSAVEELHVGDIGTRLIATMYNGTAIKDISLASNKQFIIKKPDGTKVTVSAIFLTNGSDGQIYYPTDSDTFDQAGYYKIQGYIAIGASAWKSSIHTFRVYPNL